MLIGVPGGWSLAYIGTAASTAQPDGPELYSRRFRLGDKKEAAGVCRGCGESMEFESEPACNQRDRTLQRKVDTGFVPAHTALVWHNAASAAPAASFLSAMMKFRVSRITSRQAARTGKSENRPKVRIGGDTTRTQYQRIGPTPEDHNECERIALSSRLLEAGVPSPW
jgi:hypothetical protein